MKKALIVSLLLISPFSLSVSASTCFTSPAVSEQTAALKPKTSPAAPASKRSKAKPKRPLHERAKVWLV